MVTGLNLAINLLGALTNPLVGLLSLSCVYFLFCLTLQRLHDLSLGARTLAALLTIGTMMIGIGVAILYLRLAGYLEAQGEYGAQSILVIASSPVALAIISAVSGFNLTFYALAIWLGVAPGRRDANYWGEGAS